MKYLTLIANKILKCFSLILIAAILILVPLKILSFGWSPNYAMLISSALTQNGDLTFSKETIKESIKENIPIYVKAKENNLIYIVTLCFIVFNIAGLCFAPNKIAWFAALSFLMLSNDNFIIRLLNCSPQILLCILILSLYPIFLSDIKTYPKTSSLIIIVYIFMLRTIVPPEIYAIDEMNINYNYYFTLQIQEFFPILKENCWLLFAFAIIWLSSYKNKTKLIQQLDNSVLFTAFFLQMFINIGYTDLALFRDTLVLIWMTEQISELICKISCFKELRVKAAMGLYVLVVFFLLATHDGLGRYSKKAIVNMPIDFSMKELAEWAPKPGGIIFNDSLEFAFSQYYNAPNSNYSLLYLNNFSLFEKERENILNIKRMILKQQTPLPDFYEEWVEQMTPKDRLITSKRINGLENIEWLQCGRKWWVGRLKTKDSTIEN